MKKFAVAFRGLKLALCHKAVRLQCFLALLAIIGGFLIRLDVHEWLAFVICMTLVLLAEIFNTAVEKIGDYLNEREDERIAMIKDLSSAAVLVAAIGALSVCIICTLRRLIG